MACQGICRNAEAITKSIVRYRKVKAAPGYIPGARVYAAADAVERDVRETHERELTARLAEKDRACEELASQLRAAHADEVAKFARVQRRLERKQRHL